MLEVSGLFIVMNRNVGQMRATSGPDLLQFMDG